MKRSSSNSDRLASARSSLLAVLVLLSIAATSSPRNAHANPAQAPTEEGRAELEENLRQWAGKHSGRLLVRDAKLKHVAQWLAETALDGPVDRSRVRHRMWREGIVDFEFTPVAMLLPPAAQASPREALAALLNDSSAPWQRYNTLAVATAKVGARLTVAMLLTRRVARIRKGQDAQGGGERLLVSLPGDYQKPSLFITTPAGDVLVRKGQVRRDGTWQLDSALGLEPGSSLVELVAEGPRGPEVLALWQRSRAGKVATKKSKPRTRRKKPKAGESAPLAHNPYLERGAPPTGKALDATSPAARLPDSDAAAWVVGARSGPARPPNPKDARLAEEHLWALIQRTRKSRNLLPLRKVAGLTRAARRHADDLRRGEIFGHETSSGNAMQRIEAQGVTVLRATENVAVAASVAEAHAALMASPSHRANLLDPQVSTGGVGVVLKRDARGRWSAVVSQLFAQLLPDGPGDQWHAAILNRINDRRAVHEVPKLQSRKQLDQLAEETSRTVIESQSPELSPEQRHALAEKARFHYLNVRRVGVDLLVTANPQAVDSIRHALESSFKEVGIGIVRLKQPMGKHASGALVITLVFIER